MGRQLAVRSRHQPRIHGDSDHFPVPSRKALAGAILDDSGGRNVSIHHSSWCYRPTHSCHRIARDSATGDRIAQNRIAQRGWRCSRGEIHT